MGKPLKEARNSLPNLGSNGTVAVSRPPADPDTGRESAMDETTKTTCPECDPLTRREFLKHAGLVAAAGALPVLAAAPAASAAKSKKPAAETVVISLYDSLTPGQREKVALPWSHPNRARVDANWAIVDETVGDFFNKDQQAMIAEILKGVTSEQFYPQFQKQMQDDGGGIGNYHVALFGDPSSEQFEWVMTGRHMTMRASGHSVPNRAFGGPIFYGHAVTFLSLIHI